MPKLVGDDPHTTRLTEWRMFTVTPDTVHDPAAVGRRRGVHLLARTVARTG